MAASWTSSMIDGLTDWTRCPRCTAPLRSGVCTACGTDLRRDGAALARATEEAVEVLRRREQLVGSLPYVARPAPAPAYTAPAGSVPPGYAAPVGAAPAAGVPAGAVPPVGTVPPPSGPTAPRPAAASGSSAQLSLQSVLAVAGAGLFAIAAIVFTFLNPDLADFTARSLIVAGVTAVFVIGAWLLARIRLQVSAESVGALGIVFVGLDVSSVARVAAPDVPLWTAAAIATLVAGALLLLVANLARIRTWFWAGLMGLALVPTFAGFAAQETWYAMLGHLGSGVVLVLVLVGVRVVGPRLAGTFRAERVAATALQLLVILVVIIRLVVDAPPSGLDRPLVSALVLAALALLAALTIRGVLPDLFATLGGVLLALAGVFAALVAPWREDEWVVTEVAAGAALATLVLVAALGLRARGDDRMLRLAAASGAGIVALLAAMPALLTIVLQTLSLGALDEPAITLAAVVALLVVAGAAALAGLAARWSTGTRRATHVVTLWAVLTAVLGLAGWGTLGEVGRAAVGIGAPLVLTAVAVATRGRAPRWTRTSLVVAAHVLLGFALLSTRGDAGWTPIVIGFIVVAALLAIARGVPAPARFLHTALALALALASLGEALTLSGATLMEAFGIVGVTAVVVAAVATLVRALPARHWYAILVVVLVPVVLQVALVVPERTGWATVVLLPAAAASALVMLWRRPGELGGLRIAAAAAIVPALAVAVVDAAAVHLDALVPSSGSPVALPLIAAITALVLPTTLALARLLERRGVDAATANGVRIAVEVSALTTAGIAVPIAIARAAAGFETSFWVLAIVGLGGAATALFTARRYGWIIAAASWTGALWSLLALVNVTVLEPYLLPPAVASILFGAIAVLRGRNTGWFYGIGLGVAIVPSLVLLAVVADPSPVQAAWRLWGLAGASVLLTVVGLVARADLARPLRVPSLIAATIAAAAPAVQAMRLGTGLDTLGTAEVVGPVLALSALSALLAVGAAIALGRPSRYAFAPALAFLTLGTLTGVRPDLTITTWVFGGLMVVFLVAVVLVALRSRRTSAWLPPVWLLFLVAWGMGVAAWSTRLLYVEWYSFPMALALLVAGALAVAGPEPRLDAWPHGRTGSWRRYGPGLVVALLPSLLSTGTNPATWRAILVIALALAAILVGSRLRLAAPFLLGIAVLPLENTVVFAVQLGRDIETAPWWITLASAGIVLLALAVMSERRTAGGGLVERIRDLK